MLEEAAGEERTSGQSCQSTPPAPCPPQILSPGLARLCPQQDLSSPAWVCKACSPEPRVRKQRPVGRGSNTGEGHHRPCSGATQPHPQPLGKSALVLWEDGLGQGPPLPLQGWRECLPGTLLSTGHNPPHQEGLDTWPRRDMSSPGPEPQVALGLTLGRGTGKEEQELLGTGLEDRVEGQTLTEKKLGRVVSGCGQRGWRGAGLRTGPASPSSDQAANGLDKLPPWAGEARSKVWRER